MRTNGRRRTKAFAIDVVVGACATSAGVHAGLAPEHLREATQLGGAFIASVALLAATAAVLATHDESRRAAQAAALLLVGLITVEALGFLFALKLIQPVDGEPSSTSEEVRL